MKILVVDDDDLNIKILNEILYDAKFTTVTAEDGEQALARLQEHDDIDIILLDRMMPNMDGMAFMEELKKRPEYVGMPVIMQTAAASVQDVIEGSNSGVYYYLTKPYEENMVLSVVRAAADEVTKSKAG